MIIKTTTKTVFEVDSSDLDEAINQWLKSKGIDTISECVCDNEWHNDSCYSFDNVTNQPDDFWETYSKPDIEKGDLSFSMSGVLQYMCIEGAIPPGNYLVSVCW